MVKSLGLSALGLSVGLLLFHNLSLAAPITYGPEFEFTNDFIAQGSLSTGLKGHEHEAARQLSDALMKKCAALRCKVSENPGKWQHLEYDITFEDGFWIHVGIDPRVVEVTMKPLTLTELRQRETFLDDLIFHTAREIGLKVDPGKRAGHFNFGVRSTFGDSAELFLRHFIDFQSRPELSLGILRKNLINASPLAALDQSQRDALVKLTKDLSQELAGGKSPSIASIAARIQKEVYTRAYFADWSSHYFQAIGLKSVVNLDTRGPGDQPEEIRSVRSQRNMKDFILLAELHEARIIYLKKQSSTPLLYTGTARTEFTDRELTSRFYIYVVESGLNWNRMKDLLPAKLLHAGLDEFVHGRPNWNSETYRQSLRSHLELIAESVWVRARLETALQGAVVARSEAAAFHAKRVLAEIAVLGQDGRFSADARAAFLKFHDRITKLSPRLEPGAALATEARVRFSSELCRAVFSHP